jgi:hypothetical protein
MADIRALVRKAVLEEFLSGEVLEIRVLLPAIAPALIRQAINLLEQQYPTMNRVAVPGRPCSL